MLKRFTVQSAALLILGTLIAGQTGPCVPAPAGQNAGNPAGGGPVGASLVGVWRATYNDPLVGPAQIELILMADGTFMKSTTSATTLTGISGPYFVDFPAQNLLRLMVHDWFPKEFCGPLGCTVIQPVAGESFIFTLINNNTLQLTDFNCPAGQEAACTIVLTRAV